MIKYTFEKNSGDFFRTVIEIKTVFLTIKIERTQTRKSLKFLSLDAEIIYEKTSNVKDKPLFYGVLRFHLYLSTNAKAILTLGCNNGT